MVYLYELPVFNFLRKCTVVQAVHSSCAVEHCRDEQDNQIST